MRKLESEKIAEALRGELKAGRWKAGERLPSVSELRERFGVGEWSVRHALQNLRDDGFITIRQNAGAVATEKPLLLPRGRIAFVAVGAHRRVVNRVSDLPRFQLSGSWGIPSGLRPVGLGYLGVPSCDFRYAKAPRYVRRGT